MRVPRVLLEILVFTAGATMAFGQSVNSERESPLGPVDPRGSYGIDSIDLRFVLSESDLDLITRVSASYEEQGDESVPVPLTFSEDEVQYFPGSEAMPNPRFGFVPIRAICRPIAAQMIEPSPFGLSSACPIPVHPDEIQFHLSAVGGLLSNLGLASEAKRIQEFQEQFQHDHYQRLLIAHKEAQLRVLMAEIASLKQSQQSIASDARREIDQSSAAPHSTPANLRTAPLRTLRPIVIEAKAVSEK